MVDLRPLSLGHRIRHDVATIRVVWSRPASLAILLTTGVGYWITYLWAIQDLAFRRGVNIDIFVVDRPLSRVFEPAPGTYSYEPIALIEFGFGTLLLSPINMLLGLSLAVLVGLNLALTYLAITQPKSCGISAGSGVLAAVPALLAGSACCAPFILIALGITATGSLLATLPILLPIGFLMLLISLVYLVQKIDPHVGQTPA